MNKNKIQALRKWLKPTKYVKEKFKLRKIPTTNYFGIFYDQELIKTIRGTPQEAKTIFRNMKSKVIKNQK